MSKKHHSLEGYSEDWIRLMNDLVPGRRVEYLPGHPAKRLPVFGFEELERTGNEKCLLGRGDVTEEMISLPWLKRRRRTRRLICDECGTVVAAWNPTEVRRQLQKIDAKVK